MRKEQRKVMSTRRLEVGEEVLLHFMGTEAGILVAATVTRMEDPRF
jgi:hypothetical protein